MACSYGIYSYGAVVALVAASDHRLLRPLLPATVMAYIVTAYTVMACIVTACLVTACGLYSCGLHSHDLYIDGL